MHFYIISSLCHKSLDDPNSRQASSVKGRALMAGGNDFVSTNGKLQQSKATVKATWPSSLSRQLLEHANHKASSSIATLVADMEHTHGDLRLDIFSSLTKATSAIFFVSSAAPLLLLDTFHSRPASKPSCMASFGSSS
mmetsp:Transcript_39100/g.85742  ORF Transcript_39100/g.85742 Transcript_39100/m.85742 type:complete len:138 (+) Transcript_39100:57-470(+)